MMLKPIYTLLIAGLISISAMAQPSTRALDQFISATIDSFEIPSISVAIVKNGEVIYSGSHGVKSTTNEAIAIDENTQYAIASLSKAFTAASIGMLVDEGKLDWNDKVIDHLPWFKMHDEYVTRHMTITDLLSHRSGLITFDGDLLWYGSNYSREEVIKRIQYREPTYEFRTEFGYQNIMFMTAGEVIEAASGMTWDDFIKTRILEPLEMKNTTSEFARFNSSTNRAEPHINMKEIGRLSYDNCGATAALNSSANDMSKWVTFWLNGGIYNGDTLLSQKSISHIWSLQTPLQPGGFDARNTTHFKGYGQGWFLMDYNNSKVIHHGGGLPGYITKVALVPEDSLGMVILTNDMSSVPTMLMYAILDWQAGKDMQPWLTQFIGYKKRGATMEAESKEKRAKSQEENPNIAKLKAYVGTYNDAMYGDVVIEKKGNSLHMTMVPSDQIFKGALTPWAEHTFKWTHQDPFLTYGLIKFEVIDDNVLGFSIDLPNYDFHFDKLNFRKE